MTREKTPPGPARSGADLAKASMAPNTRRAYEAALRGFEGSDYPETDAGVAAYLGELYDHGRSAAVAAIVVAALAFPSEAPGPGLSGGTGGGAGAGRLQAHGRGARLRTGGRDSLGAGGPRRGDGRTVRRPGRAARRRHHSGGERRAAPGIRDIEALDVGDVDLEEQTLLIRRSKTDQEGAGAVQFLGEPTVARVRAWLLGASLTGGGALPVPLQGGPVADGTPDGEEHAPHHHPPRP